MLERLFRTIKKLVPNKLFGALQPTYHYLLALGGALLYRFPSRKIKVVGVTGTKGKSTTVELINTILERAGHKTAILGTIRIKIGDTEERNLFKMTMPGRFFVQQFLRKAVVSNCDWVILEMTSEGARQYRHKFIDLDALVFTNLSPEHIESHGSFEKYRDAKRALGRALETSHKKIRAVIANADDEEGEYYLGLRVERSLPFSLGQTEFTENESGITFTFDRALINLPLQGTFNLMNTLAAAAFAKSQGVDTGTIKSALEKFAGVRGRVEYIQAGQSFNAVVDYAHTPDSLEKFYGIFKDGYNICVLGNTGGGRDTWKRPKMAQIAETSCREVIFTNEDPYDEDPEKLLDEMAAGIEKKEKLTRIIDRRKAIQEALARADTLRQAQGTSNENINVLITGKGTDPYIMGPSGSKIPWDDATVVREELAKLGYNKTTT